MVSVIRSYGSIRIPFVVQQFPFPAASWYFPPQTASADWSFPFRVCRFSVGPKHSQAPADGRDVKSRGRSGDCFSAIRVEQDSISLDRTPVIEKAPLRIPHSFPRGRRGPGSPLYSSVRRFPVCSVQRSVVRFLLTPLVHSNPAQRYSGSLPIAGPCAPSLRGTALIPCASRSWWACSRKLW